MRRTESPRCECNGHGNGRHHRDGAEAGGNGGQVLLEERIFGAGSAFLVRRGGRRCTARQRLAILVDPQALGQADDIKAASDFSDARLGAARDELIEGAIIVVGAMGAIKTDSSLVFKFKELLQLGGV